MPPPEIDVDELAKLVNSGATLIDVREHDEFRQARIFEARHIPLADVPGRMNEVPGDEVVYVICAKGGRSRAAVHFMREQGIDAVNVGGGTAAWIKSGRPVETEDQT